MAGADTSLAPLVLLHGSNGYETDLLPLAEELAPGAAKLGVRGTVAMEPGYAFFRRSPDRRLDEDAIVAAVPALSTFIEKSCVDHNLTGRPVAVGFSNGAIMVAALLITRPGLFERAILFRPLSPFAVDPPHLLDGTPVLIVDGAKDVRRSSGDGRRLAERLRRAGALVIQHELPVGHRITSQDVLTARQWLG
ncbi:hypothetical protein EXU48_20225 [Occultella glacieicola]|uniref:Esterase n=1 Tax=Occultella glacieicola TaxID=2518684 RepID=A0ABY2DYC8_9MICO|nr:hypothetical protein [Occultella glacieicola]TDE89495.1 hypothetical protein EXU48_20225 [Occultella glacieicola]